MTDRRNLLLIVFTVLLVGQPAAADASVICERLRDRLASLPVTVANTAELRSYSGAIARQNIEIRKVRYDMQKQRCGTSSVIVFDASGQTGCGKLSAALTRMEQNKAILLEKREALQRSGAGNDPVRARLLAALSENGCDEPPEPDAGSEAEPPQTRSPPDGYIRTPETQTSAELPIDDWRAGLQGHGTLRTLCVRTCDGAFFPISSNVTPVSFIRDERLCRQMCPGTETELYFHSILNQESADMVSTRTGRPYRDLPSAFAYLNRPAGSEKACGCNLAAFHQMARRSDEIRNGEPGAPYSAITEIKSRAIAGSETRADEPLDPRERPYDPDTDAARQVGPVFLPAQTSSIDLRNPATSGPQPAQQ